MTDLFEKRKLKIEGDRRKLGLQFPDKKSHYND